MDRRTFTVWATGLVSVGYGASVYHGDREVSLPDTPDAGSEDSEPDKILTTQLDSSVFSQIEFFDNGDATITFVEEHVADAFAITHSAKRLPGDAYGEWEAPEFAGPVTVDLRGVIADRDGYPDNVFQIDVVAEDDDEVALFYDAGAEFEVPESYMPD